MVPDRAFSITVPDSIESRLGETVRALAHSPRSLHDSEGLMKTSGRIARRLRDAPAGMPGIRLIKQDYQARGARYRNVIVRLGPEPSPKNPITVMGAHYDSYSDSPGADDNASSVAVLIELLRSLAHRAHELTTPLELAFWACEEPPAFSSNAMGSDRHASYLRSRGIGVGLVVILEMVGYYSDRQTVRTINFTSDDGTRGRTLLPARGDFLLVTGTDGIVVGDADVALREAGLRTVALPAYTDLLDICDGLNWSDTKRLLITDTGMYRNPHYHRVTDRPGTLDFGRIAMLAEGLASFLFR